jgi:Tfp pilus assembly protein PilF
MALWQDNTNVRTWKNLALTYGRIGDQRHAQETWLRVRQLAPSDPDVQKVFGLRR